MSNQDKRQRASRRAAPPCWTPSDADIRKAVEADIQQYLTDSLTPDRGYAIPIANVKTLVQRMASNTTEQARAGSASPGSAGSALNGGSR